jgi:hypothetical protein
MVSSIHNLSADALFQARYQFFHQIDVQMAAQSQFNGSVKHSLGIAHYISLFKVSHTFKEVLNQLMKTKYLETKATKSA